MRSRFPVGIIVDAFQRDDHAGLSKIPVAFTYHANAIAWLESVWVSIFQSSHFSLDAFLRISSTTIGDVFI